MRERVKDASPTYCIPAHHITSHHIPHTLLTSEYSRAAKTRAYIDQFVVTHYYVKYDSVSRDSES
jgi:hypothetical protein